MKEALQSSWSILHPPKLTRGRIRAALVVAIVADVSQWCLGPVGLVGGNQAIDIVAMACTVWLLGFHVLLLPTVFLEFLPVVDLLPTWTGCVLLVIARRKKQEAQSQEPIPAIVNPPAMLPEPAPEPPEASRS